MGRASVEEDKPAKLIFSRMCTFSEVPRKLWVRYADVAECEADFAHLTELLSGSDGSVPVSAVCVAEKQVRNLPRGIMIDPEDGTYDRLVKEYGAERIAFTYRSAFDRYR